MPAAYRSNLLDQIQKYWSAQPLFLDTETTGLDNSAEIIEISIVDHEGHTLYDSLVRPLRPIPMDAVRLHGITDDMVINARTWLHIWPEVEAILAGRWVGIYNVEFDVRMMQQSHRAIGMPWRSPNFRSFDIMKLFAEFAGYQRWLRLEQAGQMCRINLPNSHRALDDTLLARAVFDYMRQFAG
ncbi:MAG TPA: 3'-5' exonuclease [Anaerolineales bacterium]|nr:3'-5' exonuclease [Anaerolineales bacterium]